VLCAGLNLLFLPTLDADTKQRLMDASFPSRSATPAWMAASASPRLDSCRYCAARPKSPSAPAPGLLPARAPPRDPDTLFFSRRLTIDGDTELGLLVKNALDAID